MRYIDITWHHQEKDEPCRLVSEISADGFEKRKLEFFRDGQVGYASGLSVSDTTMLSVGKIPPLDEIISRAEFSGAAISREQFEQLWAQHVPDDA